MKHDAKRGVVPPDDVQVAVKTMLGKHSEAEVVKRLGVSRIALARLAAGLTVRRGTIALVHDALGNPAVPS